MEAEECKLVVLTQTMLGMKECFHFFMNERIIVAKSRGPGASAALLMGGPVLGGIYNLAKGVCLMTKKDDWLFRPSVSDILAFDKKAISFFYNDITSIESGKGRTLDITTSEKKYRWRMRGVPKCMLTEEIRQKYSHKTGMIDLIKTHLPKHLL